MRLFALTLVGLVGCYAPQPAPGAPCAADGTCPTGLLCIADRCVPPGTATDASLDAVDPDAADPDAMIDAPIDAGPIMPKLIQQATGTTGIGTLNVSFPQAPTAGNLLVAVTGCPTGSIGAISGASSSWMRVASSTTHANVEVYIGTATGGTSVSVGLLSCVAQMSLSISEWANMAPTPIEEPPLEDDGTDSPATAGSMMVGSPRLVLFSVATYVPNTFGTPSDGPWDQLTPIAPASGVEMRTWYRVITQDATIAPAVSETRHEWDATLVALEALADP